jgi:hypothetical protein
MLQVKDQMAAMLLHDAQSHWSNPTLSFQRVSSIFMTAGCFCVYLHSLSSSSLADHPQPLTVICVDWLEPMRSLWKKTLGSLTDKEMAFRGQLECCYQKKEECVSKIPIIKQLSIYLSKYICIYLTQYNIQRPIQTIATFALSTNYMLGICNSEHKYLPILQILQATTYLT